MNSISQVFAIGAVSEALLLSEAAGVDPKTVRVAIKTGFAVV